MDFHLYLGVGTSKQGELSNLLNVSKMQNELLVLSNLAKPLKVIQLLYVLCVTAYGIKEEIR